MSPLVDRFIMAGDVTPEQTWRLVDWCAEHGADEFTLAMLLMDNSPAPFLDGVTAALKRFERVPAPRKAVTVWADESAVQTTRLWDLTPESIAVLKGLFPNGLFAAPSYQEVGWLEDPTLYRDAQMMLGIVSHEHEGVLTLTDLEHVHVAALGIPTRESSEWI